MFDAIAAVVDAQARPTDADDQRTPAQRQAEALADACGYVLDHGDVPFAADAPTPERARAAGGPGEPGPGGCLDFGGRPEPRVAADAVLRRSGRAVVLDGKGQPLDVGRATRVIPDGLRRAVAARDGGCARCGRPASWCEVHHVVPWERGGATSLANTAMVCRACHRLIHHAGWDVKLVDGRPEFYPPPWIDPLRRPRRRPPPAAYGLAG